MIDTYTKTPVCGVGIIGYGPGPAAQTFHMPLLKSEPRFDVRIVSTMMPDIVRPLLPQLQVTENVTDVIEHPDVQLVVIATPNAWHYQYAKQALMAGKHVVVEKPLAITVAEADELIQVAETKGVILSQFHNRRWDGGFLTVQKLLGEGRLGRLSLLEMNYDRFEPQLSGNWREDKSPGNGMLYDLGVHLLDQAIALLGRPHAVQATILSQRVPDKADDYFHLSLDYGHGQAILRASLLAAQPGPRYRACGDVASYVKAGAVQQDPQAGMLINGLRPGNTGWGEDAPEMYGVLTDATHSEAIPTVPGSYQSFYETLAAAILNAPHVSAPVEVADARDIIAIIEAAQLSHREGRTVTADEIGFLIPPVQDVASGKEYMHV